MDDVQPLVSTITLWKNGQTFSNDADVQYDVLQIEDNAQISFLKSITFRAKCNRLIMGQNVKIVGTGANGSDGETPHKLPDIQCTGTPDQHQYIVHPGFLFYARGTDGSDDKHPYRSIGYNASSPTPGQPGARISITYHAYEGYAFDKDTQALVGGGHGGKGARGGEGATVHCTQNPCGGVLQGPSGAGSSNAQDGASGSFALIEDKKKPVEN